MTWCGADVCQGLQTTARAFFFGATRKAEVSETRSLPELSEPNHICHNFLLGTFYTKCVRRVGLSSRQPSCLLRRTYRVSAKCVQNREGFCVNWCRRKVRNTPLFSVSFWNSEVLLWTIYTVFSCISWELYGMLYYGFSQWWCRDRTLLPEVLLGRFLKRFCNCLVFPGTIWMLCVALYESSRNLSSSVDTACSCIHCTRVYTLHSVMCRSQWPRGLRLLACWYGGFESHRGYGYSSVVSVVCCQIRGLCDELITRPEESYRLWCVVRCVWATKPSEWGVPGPLGGCCSENKLNAVNEKAATLLNVMPFHFEVGRNIL